MWFIGVEVEQETSAPPPKKNPGSAPGEQTYISPLLKGQDQLRFLENCSPTPPLSQNFALSEK